MRVLVYGSLLLDETREYAGAGEAKIAETGYLDGWRLGWQDSLPTTIRAETGRLPYAILDVDDREYENLRGFEGVKAGLYAVIRVPEARAVMFVLRGDYNPVRYYRSQVLAEIIAAGYEQLGLEGAP